jgi:hypothetical protein
MPSWLSIRGPEGFGERSSHHADRGTLGVTKALLSQLLINLSASILKVLAAIGAV